MEENGAHIVALNCGTGMDMERALAAVERYKSATSLPVMVQPNAGKPKLVNMKVVYDETPEQMVKGLMPLLECGRQYRRHLLRQHARTYARIQKSDGRISANQKDSSPWERNVKAKLCDVNADAVSKLPKHTDDKSGIGVHYVDAYIKPMNIKARRRDAGEMQAARIEDHPFSRRQKGRRPDAPA